MNEAWLFVESHCRTLGQTGAAFFPPQVLFDHPV